MNIVDRVVLLLHPKYHEKNLNFIVNTFLENDYPTKFIFDMINSRLKSLLKYKILKQADSDNTKNEEITTCLQFHSFHIYMGNLKTSLKT